MIGSWVHFRSADITLTKIAVSVAQIAFAVFIGTTYGRLLGRKAKGPVASGLS